MGIALIKVEDYLVLELSLWLWIAQGVVHLPFLPRPGRCLSGSFMQGNVSRYIVNEPPLLADSNGLHQLGWNLCLWSDGLFGTLVAGSAELRLRTCLRRLYRIRWSYSSLTRAC